MASAFSDLDKDKQIRLLGIIGQIGDLRGVPLLIQAMSSPDLYVWSMAEDTLRSDFPDAPGMREALEKTLADPDRARNAARFLTKHEPNNRRLKSILASNQTPYAKAYALRQSGDLKGCKALYLKIIGDTHENDSWRLYIAKDFLTLATPADKNRLRPVLLPLLMKDVASAGYIDTISDATLLRNLHHSDCLPALLQILARPASISENGNQIAMMAVRDLGPEARRKAVVQLINRIKNLPAPAINTDELLSGNNVYFAELAALGSAADYTEAKRGMDAGHLRIWELFRPLAGISEQPDQGEFLMNLLKISSSKTLLSDQGYDWIIFCLGNLHDQRAVPLLYQSLLKYRYSFEADAVISALEQIGGAQTEQIALTLLTSPDKEAARPRAVQILAQIQGPKILPLLRRMLRESDFGDKTSALRLLAQYGTPDDLKALIPLADFWTGDREFQRDAHDAVATIRDRYNYDIYGPIKVQ